MSNAPFTVSEFLSWAETRLEPPRAELIAGRVVPIAPQSPEHARARFEASRVLRHALTAAGLAGEIFTGGMLVPIAADTAYEPDVVLRLGTPLIGGGRIVTDPVIVVDVAAATPGANGSAADARAARLAGWLAVPSVAHCLLVDPIGRTVTHHARGADGNGEDSDHGRLIVRTRDAGLLTLDPPGITIEIADLFA
ncbi:Uma2 family endonuclease [Rhodoplanes azumiensis]|uniref:Uma2 family endonuclease n=1 Tax=Rhodoplanes azumiensis TaxID=1897628 RepID=A0ABW5AQ03_9BRAD